MAGPPVVTSNAGGTDVVVVVVVRRALTGSTNDAVTLPLRIPSKQLLPPRSRHRDRA